MKKLITILAIMIVLVGAVFADVNGQGSNGTAVIDIKCVINESHPTFQLYAKDIVTQATGNNGDVLTSNVAGTPTHGQVTITTDKLLTADAVITFAIRQINYSRSTANYTLGVAATNLTLDNYATVGASTLEEDEQFEVTISDLTVNSNYGSTSTNGIKITTPSTSSFAADYDGKVVNGSTTPVELATFKATWGTNANAVAGNYSATVTLTITATN